MAKNKTLVRVLAQHELDGIKYKPNQLVSHDTTTADALVRAGKADDSKAAVSYLQGTGEQAVEHKAPEAEPEKKEPQS